MKITTWELGLGWSLIIYVMFKLSSEDGQELLDNTGLFIIVGIPTLVSLFYILWIYPLSLFWRKGDKGTEGKKR